MKYFLTLLLFILTVQSAYCVGYYDKPRINKYTPSKQVQYKKDFLTGKYINLKDPNLIAIIEFEEQGATPKNTNKYIYSIYKYEHRRNLAYAYRYGFIGGYWAHNPCGGQGSETEDAR